METLRRLPGTFFDDYFRNHYAKDICEDGSIFIDRDGEHFEHVLNYLKNGVLAVAEENASEQDSNLLRWLKREFDFYRIELSKIEKEETVFAVGGADKTFRPSKVMERCDKVGGEWKVAAPMGTARNDPGVCAMRDGLLYVTGGVGEHNERLSSVERYNPSLKIWSTAPSMPRGRFNHTCCAIDDAMYVIGGWEAFDERPRSVLKFDSRTQMWSEMAPMPAGRYGAAACVLGTDIYIFGGKDDENPTATTYRFSPTTGPTGIWAILAPMPVANSHMSASAVGGMIYVMGSYAHCQTCAVRRYDPTANAWSQVASLTTGRITSKSFVLGGSMYVVGGRGGVVNRLRQNVAQILTTAERYCPDSDTWSEVRGMALTVARCHFDVAVLTEEKREASVFDGLIDQAEKARRSKSISTLVHWCKTVA
jgi:N-acetylneuraminic acid mutarotase